MPSSPLDIGTAPKSPAGDADSAITALEKLAARIEKDDNGEVVVVNLTNTQVTDAGLVHLKGLTKMKVPILYGTEVTDTGLAHLKGLTSLHTLNLQYIQVTDVGIAELNKALPNCKIKK